MKRIGIFLDLDGTLINSEKKISNFDKEVINLLKSKVNIYLITGKSFENSIHYYNQLGLDSFFITSAGQVISKPNDESFQTITHTISSKELEVIVNEIKSTFSVKKMIVETTDGKVFASDLNSSNLSSLIAQDKDILLLSSTLDNIIGTYLEIDFASEKILLSRTKLLNKKYKDKFDVSFWKTEGNCPIINIKLSIIDKAKAMKWVMEKDNLNYSIAFGNGWTDRNMLSEASEGYAMINSVDKIKSFAKFITKLDNNNSGVGNELIRIFKNKKE